jgi:hypothetical protein
MTLLAHLAGSVLLVTLAERAEADGVRWNECAKLRVTIKGNNRVLGRGIEH